MLVHSPTDLYPTESYFNGSLRRTYPLASDFITPESTPAGLRRYVKHLMLPIGLEFIQRGLFKLLRYQTEVVCMWASSSLCASNILCCRLCRYTKNLVLADADCGSALITRSDCWGREGCGDAVATQSTFLSLPSNREVLPQQAPDHALAGSHGTSQVPSHDPQGPE